MNAWELPSALVVGGNTYNIRTDYRAILDILKYNSDPDYEDDERALITLQILFEDYENIPHSDYQAAITAACELIDMGIAFSNGKTPHLMDWEQDAPLIIPAVNHVLGQEIRALPYMHWWTFLSAYMDIGDGLFSTVLHMRQKKARGEKLEKHERRFVAENSNIVNLKTKYSEDDKSLLAEWGIKTN